MADRKSKNPRAPDAARGGKLRVADPGRALAEASARVSDQSGRLAGEDPHHATKEDAAHWIAVYSELLSFKAELLEVTARRRLSMPKDARGEAKADEVVIAAQADKYTRRLNEWRGRADAKSAADPGAPVLSLFVEGHARLFGHLLIDPWKRTVVNGGQQAQLTSTEWQLLRIFLEHPAEILTRAQLAAGVWPDGFEPPFGKVEVSVSRLRRKLESAAGEPPLIETVRGNGYRLVLPLESLDGHGPPSSPRMRPAAGRRGAGGSPTGGSRRSA
jgi:DNA-binding winged helix-turn-helix (wHTH) protein